MAEKINIGIDITDNGKTKNLVKDANELRKAYNGVNESVAGMRAAMAPKTTAAVKSASQSPMENIEYGQARASVGTGAAGRDFAKQAQGLGGLVHVYATFAANIFAVSAAFNALSNAADTTNMVEGLKQLGAASGTNLSLLSKGLVDATDGAISLKDAMKATAQASAAGMSSENLRRLGAVAKNTSLALGIDATDAVSRLSRGITKLEPELLDELGIFTKLDKATADYARQVGKPISALTDFEKRQAFANAVLTEAEQKFGNIKIDANPYSKLLASLKDATQGLLEFVNMGIGPVVKALSQSPTTLMVGIAALTALLLQKSIPAFTQWGSQLRATAEQAKETAKNTKELFDLYIQSSKDQAVKQLSDSQKSFGDAAQAGLDSARKTLKEGSRLYNKEFNTLMKLDPEELTADHKKVIEDTRKKLTAAATKAAASGDVKKAEATQGRLDTFEKAVANLGPAIDNQVKFNSAIDAGIPKLGLMAKYHEEVAKKSETASRKYNILANAIDNTSFIGPKLAFQSMILSIQGLGNQVGTFGKIWLGLKGTIAIGAVGIGMVTNVISGTLAAVGLITAALSALTVAFGKNGDQAEKSASSLSDIKSNGESLARTFELLEKSSPLEKLAPKNVAAVTNSMSELSTSILKGIKDTEKTIAARGGTDIITNWFAGWIGRSDEKLLAKRVNTELTKALELATKTPESMGIRIDLAKSLGLEEGASTKDIVDAFISAPAKGAENFDKLAKAQNTAAQSGKAYADSLKETEKGFQELENEMKLTDKLSVNATKIGKDFSDLAKILDGDVVKGFSSVLALVDNPASLVMLPKIIRDQLIDLIPVLKQTGTELQTHQSEVAAAMNGVARDTKTLEDAEKTLSDLRRASEQGTDTTATLQISKAKEAVNLAKSMLEANKQGLKLANERVANDSNVIASYTGLFKTAITAGMNRSSDILSNVLGVALQKAVISTKQAALSFLPKTEAVIDEQTKLANKQISLDIERISKETDLILELRALKLQLQDNQIQAQKLAEVNKNPELSTAERNKFLDTPTAEQKTIRDTQKVISSIQGGKTAPSVKSMVSSGVLFDDAVSLFNVSAKKATDIAPLRSQLDQNIIKGIVEKIDLKFSKQREAITSDIESTSAKLETLSKTTGLSAELRSDVEYQKQLKTLTDDLIKKQVDLNNTKVKQADETVKAIEASTTLTEEVKKSEIAELLRQKQLLETKNQELATSRLLAFEQQNISDTAELRSKRAARALELSQLDLQAVQDKIDYDKESLDVQKLLGLLSVDEVTKAERLLSIRQADKDYQLGILNLTYKTQEALSAIEKERKLASAGGAALSETQTADFEKRKKDLEDLAKTEAAGLVRNRDLRIASADSTILLLDRDKAYGKNFEQVFKGMEDAIVNFTKTGKLSFEGMINSFIEGLLRYEIQQQQLALFKGVGGATGLGSMLARSLGFGSTTSPEALAVANGTMPALAKGGAYDLGIQKFAMGGAFTNSIVNSPTLFKFAKGTGMMGEAGPEAIVPLKRDAQGNLGVRTGGGGQTSVVVNNYSNAQATTKESVDSRGNRKIDIIIGDIVAGEIGRPGSSIQQSFSNNFNARPAIARR